MSRCLLALVFILSLVPAFAQIKNLYPTSTQRLNFSAAGEKAFNAEVRKSFGESRFDTLANGEEVFVVYDTSYSGEVKETWLPTDDFESYWGVLLPGCSWYCGGRVDTVKASSALAPQASFTYNAKNAADFSYETAWVEGAKGPGIGQYLEYQFSPESARVEEVKIANGYVKSEKAWKENARVKKLKLYHNGKPYAILNLKDERTEQVFSVGPFGFNYYKIDDDKKPTRPWTLRFEILEVYPGTRYTDTAISEIHFMGYGEH